MTVGVFANAASAVLGRSVNRKSHLNPIVDNGYKYGHRIHYIVMCWNNCSRISNINV